MENKSILNTKLQTILEAFNTAKRKTKVVNNTFIIIFCNLQKALIAIQ